MPVGLMENVGFPSFVYEGNDGITFQSVLKQNVGFPTFVNEGNDRVTCQSV